MQAIFIQNSAFSAEKNIFICYVILHGGVPLILHLQLQQSAVKKSSMQNYIANII